MERDTGRKGFVFMTRNKIFGTLEQVFCLCRDIKAEREEKFFWAFDKTSFEKVMFISENFCFDLRPHCLLMMILRRFKDSFVLDAKNIQLQN